ncbi:nitrite reductase [Cytobacillus sp. FSL W8-0315]|uniref:nitrite and sulphite reductase 4Fe-4S domain-containing protein n=1 Tax=Cytobacillus TaxID=2675230 RepID=UPI0001F45758|nr:nitrite and sulphite reductase 4Fe-4S domain-containing protein [Cytobacillus pseudoceanisediminis]EFV74667.1 nitrite and sulphite reductase 4Fe-4S domain-containing protein [Bacillus sp. 2_A_57_CT2]UQX57170.1 nitrite reductase [Cytobacillus pseudoceanisediminis]
MENQRKKVKMAVNGGINFGAKLNAKQLLVIAKYMEDQDELELTTFQQLYIDVFEDKKDEIISEFEQAGLRCYPVGSFVKSLRTCNFCKGEEEEGMPVAKELNERIAGIPVPFTLKPAYTGCPVGCGEPLVNDIGIMKVKDHYDLYIGGKAKGKDAEPGYLLMKNLKPENLYAAVEKIIEFYQQQGKKREAFHKFVNRIGKETILKEINI